MSQASLAPQSGAELPPLKSIRGFHVGGSIVELSDAPARTLQSVPGLEARASDPNGRHAVGQLYVQHFALARPAHPYPVFLWHGGGMTGCTWEQTPDGRPGWHDYFMRAGYDTYVSDAVERGRASWPAPELVAGGQAEHRSIEQAWDLFRIGEPGAAQGYPGQQFPADCMPQLARQFVGRWVSNRERAIAAYAELLGRAGPGVVIAHSEGGRLAQSVLQAVPDRIKALVLVEPAGGVQADAAAFARMAAVPVCVLWGDYFDRSPLWRRYREQTDAWLDGLARAGGSVTRMDLPALGIAGNSHLPMMDRNNAELAAMLDAWIQGTHNDSI